ncbi:helix-turn-helix transcriptional regulator [Maricaulis salignorans]|uniref:helix-turn-helix transcriptional regulator n=1 Tax=Maricaulis salignorans TaxID=144026 RepID=UPI000B8104E2
MSALSEIQVCPLRTGDELVSARQVASLLKISRATFYRWRRRPDFPIPLRISPFTVRYWRSEVIVFVESKRGLQ